MWSVEAMYTVDTQLNQSSVICGEDGSWILLEWRMGLGSGEGNGSTR